jgi:hypothetical protein
MVHFRSFFYCILHHFCCIAFNIPTCTYSTTLLRVYCALQAVAKYDKPLQEQIRARLREHAIAVAVHEQENAAKRKLQHDDNVVDIDDIDIADTADTTNSTASGSADSIVECEDDNNDDTTNSTDHHVHKKRRTSRNTSSNSTASSNSKGKGKGKGKQVKAVKEPEPFKVLSESEIRDKVSIS